MPDLYASAAVDLTVPPDRAAANVAAIIIRLMQKLAHQGAYLPGVHLEAYPDPSDGTIVLTLRAPVAVPQPDPKPARLS